ncbi:cytosine deaminase [Rhodococcus wratislaviensis]|uniref:Cytosine deaminase n=1 Tax=Rhodococcus wratislaviensis TaxID=44752 RepID=A0AB38FNR0_RHOWR|nr:amidohydrolase family protein [Rhodococcus wratislaviensis]REE71465.1 cytosine deaminase [Rhodococcus wratislaviensis]SPZ43201.1 cytosine deaminase [Rhodococcus wratislaviensis]
MHQSVGTAPDPTAPGTATPTALEDVTLPCGRRADVVLRGDRIESVDDHRPGHHRPGAYRLGGALLLPALVDGHCHLDKTLLGSAWQPHRTSRTLREQITTERLSRRDTQAPATERAAALARRMVSLGTGHVRSHVDIDPDVQLTGLHALLEVREQFHTRLGIQLVAFPQSGVVTAPGVADLLDAALADGADVIGGLDPAGFDGDVDGQLNVVFGLAERHGAGVDIHLHDGGEAGAHQLREIATRTKALGLVGKVTVSHAYALGQLDDHELDQVAEALARAGVAIMTNGPSRSMPPVLRLREHGVRVFAGSDNIRDTWWPYGTADMLERATIIGLQGELMTDDDLRYAAALATDEAAAALGLTDYGLAPGKRADLVAVAAGSVPEAVASHPERLLVLHGGRIVGPTPLTTIRIQPPTFEDSRDH